VKIIDAAEAESRFSELISRSSAGERFIIRRRGRAVAVLISPEELERLERASQAVRCLALALGQDKELLERIDRREAHPAMAAFGLWRDETDMADLAELIDARRETSEHRPEIKL